MMWKADSTFRTERWNLFDDQGGASDSGPPRSAPHLHRAEIGKPKPVSLNDIAYGHRDFHPELRAPEAGRMKLAPLPARIDPGRQIRQERLVVPPTHEP